MPRVAGSNTSPEAVSSADGLTDPGKDQATGVDAALAWLLKSGPVWARVPAVIVTICIALSSPFVAVRNLMFPPNKETAISQKDPAAGQLDMTIGGKLAADEMLIKDVLLNQNATPDERAKAEDAYNNTVHRTKHLTNASDSGVPWIKFGKRSPTDYFGYKFFPSDRCLLISRVENGVASAEWLSDPNRPTTTTTASNAPATLPLTKNRAFAIPSGFFTPSFFQGESVTGSVHAGTGEMLKLIAVGSVVPQGDCLNPHPGTPAQSNGSPITACQTPTFRKWTDGCAQVQVYDHCANVWGPVVWQYCAKVHHP